MSNRRKDKFYITNALVWALIISFLFLLPMLFIFSRAFENGGKEIKNVFTSPYTYRLLIFTLKESFLSALLSILFALPFAAFFSYYKFPLRRSVLVFAQLSFTIPTILVVLGFVMWYGNNGVLNRMMMKLLALDDAPLKFLYSFKAIILSHVYLNLPIAFSLITSSWTSLNKKEEIASYGLGKNKIETFFRITLPRLKLSIIATFIMIFLFCFSSFSIVLVLGGKPEYYTLEAEIYRRTHIDVNPSSSAALSLFVFLVTSLMLLLTSGGERTKKRLRANRELKKAKGLSLVVAIFLIIILLLFILPPIITIIYRSFFSNNGTFSLNAWKNLKVNQSGISSGFEAVINSLIIALISSFLAVTASTFITLESSKNNRKSLVFLSSLPMATGSVTLGLGFSFIAANFIHKSLFLSYALIIFSHFIIALPFASRSLLPGAKSIPESLSSASYSLEKGKLYTFLNIEIPELLPYIRKAFAFSFALSLGEVNATLTMADGKVTTLPVLIFRLVNKYNYQTASALGTILIVEAFLIFLLGEIGNKDGSSRD